MKKRILSFLIVLTIIFGIIPFSEVSVSAATDDLIWPCESAYYVTCMYYYKDGSKHSTRYGYTKGIDIAGGGNIVAAASGTVETATNLGNTSFGKYVVIKHDNGYRSLYAHLSSYSVSVGQRVTQGQVIGVMGSTGNSSGTHLHFEYEGADPWKTYYNSKYASKIIFEQNVRSNNNSYNSDKTIVNVIDSNYYKSGTYYYYSGGHTSHTYTGSYYEAAHPHKVYQQCSCGATKYTGEYKTLSSCSDCSFTVDTKYNTVKGFKAYPCVSSNFVVYKSDLSTRNGEIYTTDLCTINEVYTNGWCKVTFPLDSGGTREAYTKIANFIKSPSTSLTKYTASDYINLYSTSSLSTQIYKIYPNDVCYTIGTSGSATQIFMPMSGSGYYVLGWAKTSDLTPKTYDSRFNPYCPIKAFPCATANFEVYKSDYKTRAGEIYTTDFCTINAVYSDGWCQVTFPLDSGGTITAYTPLSNFVYNVNYTHVAYKAGSQINVYTRKDLAEYLTWWVGAGDTFYVVGEYGSARQVFYPIAEEYGGGYKLGWIPSSSLPSTTYTVSYNANGGTGAPSSQTKTHGKDLTLSSTKPTRTGYTFVGWATSSSATTAKYSAGSIYSDDASVTLYAVWRKQTFTITYNANGGANAPGVQTQTYGTAITVTSEVPDKSYTVTFNANGGTVSTSSYSVDCTFASWNTKADGTGTTVKSGASYTPNANTTLYAIYTNPTLGSYLIPSRAGYTFNGWYTASSVGTRVDATTVITGNTTLYAQWNLETYSVVYYDDGSSNIPAEQTKTYGTALTLSNAVPVKDGYTFKGWATEEGSSTVVYTPGSQYTNDEWVILYAVWEENPIILTDVSVKTLPSKAVYQIGESFDSTGLILKLSYSNGTTETITNGFAVSGFDSSTAGIKTITVTYAGKTATFTVTVEENVANRPKYEITNATGTAGSTVDVYVSIANNPGIISLRSSISYDMSALELIAVQDLGLLKGYTTPSPTISSPYIVRWADSLATANNFSDGRFVKLTFKIKAGATIGNYVVSVTNIESRTFNGAKVDFVEASSTIEVVEVAQNYEIKSVSHEVSGDKVVFTVITTPNFNRVKVTKADSLDSYITYSSSYTVNANGDYVFTLSVPAIEGTTQYAFDGRRVDTNKYAKDYAYDTVKIEAEEETPVIISVSHKISSGKIVFTVVTKAGDFGRVKVTTADNLSGSLGVASSYVIDGNGNYVWTIKTTASSTPTDYAFDVRVASTGKYLKDYYNYSVSVIPTIKSVSHEIVDTKIVFTVVTKPGNFNRIKVTLADNLGGSLGVASDYTVNADGDYVWTIKATAPTEVTDYAFDLRSSDTNKYLKEYGYYSVEEIPIVKSISYTISNGKIFFTVITAPGNFARMKVTTADNLGGSLGVATTYTVNADGNYVWMLKAPEPTADTTYAVDLRDAATGKYMKDYYYCEAEPKEPTVVSVNHEIVGEKIIFTVVTKAGNYDRIKVALATNLGGSLAVASSHTVDADGNYVWTIKTAAPTAETTYAFDLRVSGGKYLKDYSYYDVE